MKKLLFIAMLAGSLAACQSNATSDSDSDTTKIALADAPKAEFEKLSYDFGTIEMGEKVMYEFKFKNVGKSPLVVKNATATCGCTVPQVPGAPVLPGETATIKVQFDSQGKLGKQDKVVTITSNANPEMDQLHLVGEVLEKK